MPTTLTVPDNYPWVLASAMGAVSLTLPHMLVVGRLRKKAGVKLPNMYATQAEMEASPIKYRYNCAQRAHGHFLENQPSMIVALLIAGLRYPQAAAAIGAAWSFFRVLFLTGYTSKSATVQNEGKSRMIGVYWGYCQLGLYGLAAHTVYKMF